jgi:hypothetical protein
MIKKREMKDVPNQEGYEVVVFNEAGDWAYGAVRTGSTGTFHVLSTMPYSQMRSWVPMSDWKGGGHHV